MSDLAIQHCPLVTESVPEGWQLVSLSELMCEIQTGFASGQHNRSGKGVPHLRPMNIGPRGTIEMEDLRYVAAENNALRLRRGDILFNNTNSPAWVGKTAYIDTDDDLAFSNHMTRLRLAKNVEARLLAQQLQYLCTCGYFQHQCKKHVNQASINRSFLAEATPLLIPPLPEQRRIVSKIEALQERSGKAREALAEVGPLLEQFRQSLLAAAFRGDLTADWRAANPDVEPASELLQRIRQQRRERWEQSELAKYEAKGKQPPKGWQDKYKGPAPVDESELPGLPEGWCWASFAECASDITVGHVGPMKHRYVSDGVVMLRSQNVRPLKFTIDNCEFIPEDFDSELVKSRLYGGEILVVRSGVNVGDCCVYPRDQGNANCSDLVITRPLDSINAYYAAMFIASPLGKAALRLRRVGNAQPHFNVGSMKTSVFPLAPLEEQSQIVRIVTDGFDSVEALTKTARALSNLADLDQSILAKAFRGELVPQDPDDEPASELLQRIREQREAAADARKKASKQKSPRKRKARSDA